MELDKMQDLNASGKRRIITKPQKFNKLARTSSVKNTSRTTPNQGMSRTTPNKGMVAGNSTRLNTVKNSSSSTSADGFPNELNAGGNLLNKVQNAVSKVQTAASKANSVLNPSTAPNPSTPINTSIPPETQKSKKKWFIIGGLSLAIIIGLIIYKKRK